MTTFALVFALAPLALSPAEGPPPLRRALATGAALVPGLVVHGAGHFVAGDRRTAGRLLMLEGIALGSFVGGLAGLALTGASRYTAPLFIPMVVGGVGLFGMSGLSDIYGVLAAPGASGVARQPVPWLEAEVGARYVHDRIFSYRLFVVSAVDVRWRSLRFAPSAWVATDDDNARLRLLAAHRFAGPRPAGTAPAPSGSHLDLEAAVTHHRYGRERFSVTTAELAVAARIDIGALGPSLRASFVDMALGAGISATDYVGVATEETELLLARFGWGFYLGGPSGRAGEVVATYDHRHDDFAAGLKLRGLGSGTGGHFGLRALSYLTERWGFLVDGQLGSAYVAGASLIFRQGATP